MNWKRMKRGQIALNRMWDFEKRANRDHQRDLFILGNPLHRWTGSSWFHGALVSTHSKHELPQGTLPRG
eukprot:CAMPEP_0184686208 /NCGR_PEP_ID=MMETSP0312-20130426/21649_1 /TAXON_ID=31354 /ORGANISM="Compsopogon coeruleus, Strain SAG 36.94" /LENGTH=68 /DNA_ID=CAMNT_0027141069 /DNA_START=252 /DNA_END=454 /DNA_ORIENTATION=-